MPVNFVKREDLIEENACIGNTATQKYPVSRAVDSHQDNMLCRIKKRVHEEVVPEEKVKPKHILGKIRKMDRMAKLQCGNILRELMKHSYGWIFYQPVDPVEWNIPDYFSVIREPMDLGTIKHKLNRNRYSSMEEFAADVRLTFSNAMLYNPPRHEVHECAKLLNGAFNKKWKSLEAELKGQGPTAANYDGQDSWQSVRKSCQDNKKEFPLMQVNPVKMVKNWSQFLGNNVQKGLSPGRSSEHNVCGASEMNDGMICGSKRRVHEEVVPEENMKHVYIRSRSTEINDADGNPSLNIHDSPNDAESTSIVKKEIPAIDLHEKTTLIFTPLAEQSDHRGFENSKSDLNFDDIKGFEDFKIHVNGEIIDSEIPLDIRIKYYQLCCRQKKFIHDRVMKGLNSKLVVAMILEIVSIADATKAASISTPPRDLKRMGKAIKSFKDLGMAVGSLRAKIDTLTKFSSEHQNVEESMKMKLAEIERERKAFEEKKAKIEELIESARVDGELIGHLEEKVDALKEKREKLRLVFNEVAGLTW